MMTFGTLYPCELILCGTKDVTDVRYNTLQKCVTYDRK